jgi:hypothetical protein
LALRCIILYNLKKTNPSSNKYNGNQIYKTVFVSYAKMYFFIILIVDQFL